MISKIKVKSFQINLTLELFMCLMLKLIELFLNLYWLGIMFFKKNCDLNILTNFLLFKFSLEVAPFFPFFPKKNSQVRKIWNQKNMLVVGEGGNPTI